MYCSEAYMPPFTHSFCQHCLLTADYILGIIQGNEDLFFTYQENVLSKAKSTVSPLSFRNVEKFLA